jgi:hypothetical protein
LRKPAKAVRNASIRSNIWDAQNHYIWDRRLSGLARKQNTMTAGRPSAVLTPDKCDAVWSKAVPKGDTLAQADAAPFIVNFSQVDTDNDGTIDKKEFQAACAKGLVKSTSQ